MRSMSLIDKSVPVAGSRVGLNPPTFKKGTHEIFQKSKEFLGGGGVG